MIWFAALMVGATMALVYCACLSRTAYYVVSTTSGGRISWLTLGLGSLVRLTVLVLTFVALIQLGADVALLALIGFSLTRSGVACYIANRHSNY